MNAFTEPSEWIRAALKVPAHPSACTRDPPLQRRPPNAESWTDGACDRAGHRAARARPEAPARRRPLDRPRHARVQGVAARRRRARRAPRPAGLIATHARDARARLRPKAP